MRTVLTALCTLPLVFSLPASAWAQSTADDAADTQPTAAANAAPDKTISVLNFISCVP